MTEPKRIRQTSVGQGERIAQLEAIFEGNKELTQYRFGEVKDAIENITAEVASVRTDFKNEVEAVRKEMKTGFAEVSDAIHALELALVTKDKVAELETGDGSGVGGPKLHPVARYSLIATAIAAFVAILGGLSAAYQGAEKILVALNHGLSK